jgi:hypothetical protein
LLERAEADLASARRELEAKEKEIKQQSSSHKTKLDEAIRKSVDEAKEKAEVRIIFLFVSLTNISFIANSLYLLQKDVRRRHVDQLNKQHESKMNKLMQDKDKQIKVCALTCLCRLQFIVNTLIIYFLFVQQHLSEVAKHNISVNADLQLTISQLKRNNQLALDSANLKAAEAISKVRKDGAAKIIQLKSTVKEKDNEIVEMQELAEGVASEYTALERSARAETSKLETTAAKRLENLKETKEREGQLRERLDTVMETYEDQLTEALAEIAKLKEELREKDFVVEGLEKDLETATEKIEVSLQVL